MLVSQRLIDLPSEKANRVSYNALRWEDILNLLRFLTPLPIICVIFHRFLCFLKSKIGIILAY